MKKELRIAFTGGGSGGHIYPLLAVAEETIHQARTSPDTSFSLFYFGSLGIHAEEFHTAGIKIKSIVSFKVRRYFSIRNIVDILLLPIALVQAFWKIFWTMPDVLFSKGGTGALPVVLAAWFFRVPIFVHESDSVPGLTNRITYPLAKRAGVAFAATQAIWDDEKTALVGNPIRPFLLESDEYLNKAKAKKILGFDSSLPLLLVLGGSLGSQRMNDFLLDNVTDLVSRYQIFHVTGPKNFESFKTELAVATKNFIQQERARYKIASYLKKEIKDALFAADVIISRAGSGAIFEIALSHTPSILVPLKESAGDHQRRNAYEYAQGGACVVIEENNLTNTIFFTQLEAILSDQNRYNTMGQAAGDFAKPDSATHIAQELIHIAQQ